LSRAATANALSMAKQSRPRRAELSISVGPRIVLTRENPKTLNLGRDDQRKGVFARSPELKSCSEGDAPLIDTPNSPAGV